MRKTVIHCARLTVAGLLAAGSLACSSAASSYCDRLEECDFNLIINGQSLSKDACVDFVEDRVDQLDGQAKGDCEKTLNACTSLDRCESVQQCDTVC